MDDVAIKIDKVSKKFKLPHEKYNSIKSIFVNFYRRKRTYELQEALKDVSLEIKKGEFFGIVGRNGSGKSTLLKLIAGIYVPTSGDIKVNGSLTPFIELGVGFNPELTGRENVYLNGALLGFNRKQMNAMYKDIVNFAELGRFMDQKLKNYSSGMQVRLAFSIAIRARSDILLLDEVLAVGDTAFQRKCMGYFQKLKAEKRTVVLVTHDMNSIRNLCTKAALISSGRLDYVGDPEITADLYESQNTNASSDTEDRSSGSQGISIEEISVIAESETFSEKDKIKLQIVLSPTRKLSANVVIQISKDNGVFVAGVTSEIQIPAQLFNPKKKNVYEYTFSADQFSNGKYVIAGFIFEKGHPRPIFFKDHLAEFKIDSKTSGWGILNLKGTWKKIS